MGAAGTIDVATLVVAMGTDARVAVQGAMQRFAETGDTKTKDGLAKLLREAIAVLVANAASFTHAYAESTKPLAPDAARARFVDATQRARSRFEVETIRNADGTTTVKAPPQLAPSSEPGVVLVTLVVARSREIGDAVEHPDRTAVRGLLDDLAATTATELVAMEVVWSPAADADRVSIATLEKKHPEIRSLD
jgi:uncharacterized membrane protein